MESNVSQKKSMNLSALPEDTKLRKLLAACKLDHEIMMTECADGALVITCFECPFHRVLDEVEEKHVREEDKGSQSPETSL